MVSQLYRESHEGLCPFRPCRGQWEGGKRSGWCVGCYFHFLGSGIIQSYSSRLSGSPTLTTPILLHLAHPFVFRIVLDTLRYVNTFRTFLGSLPAGSENSRIAKALLVDAVECSGVDFAGLISLLEETLESRQSLDRSWWPSPFLWDSQILLAIYRRGLSKGSRCLSTNQYNAASFGPAPLENFAIQNYPE